MAEKEKESTSSAVAVRPPSAYHRNSSDNPGTILVTCLLKGDNYPTWRRAILNALKAKTKAGFVDGTIQKPDENSELYSARDTCNAMVLSWIFNSLVPELHNSVAYFETARDMWVDLQERFSQRNAPRIHELKKEIFFYCQGSMTVTEYHTKLKGLWDELDTYSNVPNCTCQAYKEVLAEKEEEKLHQFLMGVNENFSGIRSLILNMEPLLNVNKAYAQITQEEKQQSVLMNKTTPEAAAFAVKPFKKAKDPNKAKNKCDNCGKLGHYTEDCFEIKCFPDWWQKDKPPQAKPAIQVFGGQKQQKVSAKASVSQESQGAKRVNLTSAQHEQLLSMLAAHKISEPLNCSGPSNEEDDWDG